MSLLFLRRGGARVEIARPAMEKLLGYRQLDDEAPEAGGVLLGRYILDTDDVVIDDITAPCTDDECSRFSFKRSAPAHQAAIDEAWASTTGRIHYLGEWHTHPESNPTPSRTDIDDWRRRVRTDRFDADFLVFVIAGLQVISAWEGYRRSGAIRKLSRRVTN